MYFGSVLHGFYARGRYRLGRFRGLCLRLAIIFFGGTCGRGLWVGKGVIWKYGPHSGVKIGHSVYLGEYCVIDVPPGGRLELGNHAKFTLGCLLAAQESITIGADTLVGEYSSIRDADHGISVDSLIREQAMVTKSIWIGQNVWIGRGVAILKGAKIGNGAVIGANSTVLSTPVPENAICVGSPQRIAGRR